MALGEGAPAGQAINIGFRNIDKFHTIGPFSAAPNTLPPSSTISDLGQVKQNVHAIYISSGGTENQMMSVGQAYHDYFCPNNVAHFWQIEGGLGSVKTVWNRSLYNFAQLIFRP